MRFIRISRTLQLRVASVACALCLLWATGTVAMVAMQVDMARDRIVLDQQQQAVSQSASKVAAYRATVDDVARDLEQRQSVLDRLVTRYFGGLPEAAPGAEPVATGPEQPEAALPAEARPLAAISERQRAFAATLTMIAEQRAAEAEAAIRKFGINPGILAQRSATGGRGGPYLPLAREPAGDPALQRLAAVLDRLDRMERSLLALPSDVPTVPVILNSTYGHRRDPFTGARAMHAGIDFDGVHNQAILAAADGVVISAGWQGGYGRAVDIRHSGGLTTRYGHLARIDVRPGQHVTRGSRIGGMGSTGRSTGTHLHFEVRFNGQPVNPRPFLEAASDVHQIKNRIRQRIDASADRG